MDLDSGPSALTKQMAVPPQTLSLTFLLWQMEMPRAPSWGDKSLRGYPGR